MGSKRQMLRNGLGEILTTESASSSRIVDLFSGSGSVSWFMASKLDKHVLANDLQEFACVLARAVVGRTGPLANDRLEQEWLGRVVHCRSSLRGWKTARALDDGGLPIGSWCKRARELCDRGNLGGNVVWKAYGGYYFSPTQALSLDAMLRTLPRETETRTICLAATIVAASCCAAAPGHTAQPFKANQTAGRYLREAWLRDPLKYARRGLREMCGLHARRRGRTSRLDANEVATRLNERDLVFVDPPYSAVQYSRFYHVLETIARGYCGTVRGAGRYPPRVERPTSFYSRPTTALEELRQLFRSLSHNGCRVVVTFPLGKCSNGLSGEQVVAEARRYFQVSQYEVESRFSTLGGNRRNRVARQAARELILVLR